MMFGEPKDVENECNALLFIGDNYGDGHATLRCHLAANHDGLHKEQFKREGGMVTITWVADEREKCDHGCGQWKHSHDDERVKCPKDVDDHDFSACSFCHPDREAKPCEACGQSIYTSKHYDCPGEPFSCTDCGENGHDVHVCPRSLDGILNVSTVNEDEFMTTSNEEKD